MARAKGITKAMGYKTRVFTVEYDLLGMMEAYGRDFIVWLMDEIAAGRIDCRSDVQRWSAHVQLTADMNFHAHAADYGREAQERREAEEATKAAENLLSKANAKKAARASKTKVAA